MKIPLSLKPSIVESVVNEVSNSLKEEVGEDFIDIKEKIKIKIPFVSKVVWLNKKEWVAAKRTFITWFLLSVVGVFIFLFPLTMAIIGLVLISILAIIMLVYTTYEMFKDGFRT